MSNLPNFVAFLIAVGFVGWAAVATSRHYEQQEGER